jgi:class 3 adenylate cyclase
MAGTFSDIKEDVLEILRLKEESKDPELLITLKAVAIACTLFRIIVLVCLALVAASFLFGFFDNASEYGILRPALAYDSTMRNALKENIPVVVGGWDLSRVILVFIHLLVLSLSESLRYHVNSVFVRLKTKQEIEAPVRGGPSIPAKSGSGRGPEVAPARKTVPKVHKRAELLDMMSQIKQELASMRRELTFLSIDIIDSTGLKKGEESSAIEMDFHAYKKMVQGILDRNRCSKAAWTPDGVMCCFDEPDSALNTGKQVIRGLVRFNRMQKTIKRDFEVRCGVNTGLVPYDEQMPAEEICDHAVDVAGHLQKHGKPSTIFVSEITYGKLSSPYGLKPTDTQVDGVGVYELKPPTL